ncbi:MAG: AAA family ATPase [Chitinivibrionales bacterium]|nr:AAA family ATPase [Chitinivibrionales bacterium]
MASAIRIPPQEIEDVRAAVREKLHAAGLPGLFSEINPGAFGTTVVNIRLLEALESGLSATIAARRALTGRIVADRRNGFAAGALTEAEERFCSLLAVAIGAQEALVDIDVSADSLPPRGKHLKLDEYRTLLSAPGPKLIDGLIGDIRSYLSFYQNHGDNALKLDREERLVACLAGYVSLLAATAQRLGDDSEYAATLEALREYGLFIREGEYRSYTRSGALAPQEETALLPVSPADIVGNAEVIQAGIALAEAIAGFDLQRGENPRRVRNPVLFVLGDPGCGKTITAHAIGNHFLDLCKRHRIPARFRIIRRTDWASHYQNKSANELLRIFKEEIFDFSGVAGAYWPDIDTAFAAREDPGIRTEDKAVLGTLFGLLDGTIGPRNGKWFLIADANYLSMDKAALSRLTQDPHYAKGPRSAADFVELMRDKKLGKVAAHVTLTDEQWSEFGRRCVECGLSGRAVDNMANQVMAELERVELPDDYYSMSFERKDETLRSLRRSFTYEQVLTLVDRYVRFEREAEERSRQRRFDRRVTEIRESLAARIAAVGGTSDGDT